MQLRELVDQVADFDRLAPKDKMRLFAWHLHAHKGVEHFGSDAIRACYREIHSVPPHNVGQYLARMTGSNPPDLVRERLGFKLTRTIRNQMDGKYGSSPSMQAVSKLLTDLPGQVPDLAEKVFLGEAIDCYRVKAYRACIVMTWNLAYGHVLEWILRDPARLAAFNNAISKRYQKMTALQINKYDDFIDELKESQVIEICNTAGLINSNIFKILKASLDRRNIAAHPSNTVMIQHQADDMVSNLVNNVVLALT